MSFCSIVAGRKILAWRKKENDRQFVKQKKDILPIRGFKGNRVIYGDIFDVEEEPEKMYFVQTFDYHHKDLDFKSGEPMYSEPNFVPNYAISTHSYLKNKNLSRELIEQSSVSPCSSPESGYLSHEVLSSCSTSSLISPGLSFSSSRGYTSRETSDDDDHQRISIFTAGTASHSLTINKVYNVV